MIGDIDSTLPIGITHIMDRSNEVCQQHGGVVTQIQFDKLEEMSLEQFLTDIVPTMKAEEKLTIIKDTVRQNMYRILRDNVAIYHITGIRDVFIDTFVDNLLSERALSITPNLTYPLIQYSTTKDGEKYITVSIPSKQFTYHCADTRLAPFVVWHPPLWMRVRLTPANVPNDVKIGVVLDRTEDPNEADVCHLPLPNCYESGDICFGSTRFNNPNPDKPLTEAMAIELTYQRLFNSAFNMDLTRRSEIEAFYEICRGLPDFEKIKEDLNTGSDFARYAKKVKYGWRDQSSIWRYPYRRMTDGRRFLGNA